MRLTPALFLATCLVHHSLQQDGNTTAPFPAATYPNATSPDPAAQENAEFSPPYYPSPWGSGAGEWASAYAKARAFVGQLTLIEKINLTTGVGYVTICRLNYMFGLMDQQVGRRTLRWSKWSHTKTWVSKHVHARFSCGRQRYRLQLRLFGWCQHRCNVRPRTCICARSGHGRRTSDERVRRPVGSSCWPSRPITRGRKELGRLQVRLSARTNEDCHMVC